MDFNKYKKIIEVLNKSQIELTVPESRGGYIKPIVLKPDSVNEQKGRKVSTATCLYKNVPNELRIKNGKIKS